ncbi:glutaredoxin family protein [Patescibacteria group bacterium]|nr:glutaredoxin family protein [Patescibacteria group bacterium]
MSKKIIIYTSPTCHHCDELKSWLKDKNLKYQEKNVLQDEKARDYIFKKSQQMGVPITEIKDDDGQEDLIVGNQHEKIGEILNVT